jgi:hypothetical protein
MLTGGGTGGRPLALTSSEFRKRRTTNSVILASFPLLHQTRLTAKVLCCMHGASAEKNGKEGEMSYTILHNMTTV